jgi:ABC-type lipoprotein export system ATPase subunit
MINKVTVFEAQRIKRRPWSLIGCMSGPTSGPFSYRGRLPAAGEFSPRRSENLGFVFQQFTSSEYYHFENVMLAYPRGEAFRFEEKKDLLYFQYLPKLESEMFRAEKLTRVAIAGRLINNPSSLPTNPAHLTRLSLEL